MERHIEAAFDLRTFLDEVRSAGELREISGAHWKLEIGALTELFAEQNFTPALLFDDIPEYARGRRVMSNVLFSPLRQALALGVVPSLRGIALLRETKRRLAELKPQPSVEVKNAPVLQNIHKGAAVDVCSFPAPLWHEKDGGRYIGTGDMVVTKDPVSR